MAPRVSPTERIRAQIHDLFEGDVDLPEVVEQVARLSLRLTLQSVMEEFVCVELDRDRYERREEDSPEGYRNGFQPPRTIKTTFGPVELLAFPPPAGHMVMRLEDDSGRSVAPTRLVARCRAWSVGAARCSD